MLKEWGGELYEHFGALAARLDMFSNGLARLGG